MNNISLLVSLVSATVAFAASPLRGQNQSWLHQFGSARGDDARAAASDGSGGVFVGGSTYGDLGGPNADPTGNTQDAWFARHDAAGNQLWVRQLGTSAQDQLAGVAPDGSGGVYVGGITSGSLGGPSAGTIDAWFARYDGGGNQIWIRQIGTTGNDWIYGAAPDASGGVYVAGTTFGNLGGPNNNAFTDGWIARYDNLGNQTWIRQFGSASHVDIWAVAADGSGGVYVTGPDSPNCFVARYDNSGNRTWIRQFGSGSWADSAHVAAPDGVGGVFIGGWTDGGLGGPNAGGRDAWFARYDALGVRTWIRQIGTSVYDSMDCAAPDGAGGLYIAGVTAGNIGGPTAGNWDAWLARYDSAGSQLWIGQFGTSAVDGAEAAAPDGAGGVCLGGFSTGNLGGPNAGNNDAFLARYVSVLDTYCTSGLTTNFCQPSISGTGTPSASAASGFSVAVGSVEGQRLGLIMYGIDNSGWTPVPWSSTSMSFLCVKPPTQRTPAQNSGGTLNQCNGVLSIDWNAFRASSPAALGQPITVGQHVYAQGWFRDPPAPKTSSLSDGLKFVVQP